METIVMDDKKKDEVNKKLNTMMALALIKNLFSKGQISEVVYKNICKEYAKEVGITTLSLEVSSKNITAYLLYKKLGFVERRTRKNYYSDGTDAIEMVRGV